MELGSLNIEIIYWFISGEIFILTFINISWQYSHFQGFIFHSPKPQDFKCLVLVLSGWGRKMGNDKEVKKCKLRGEIEGGCWAFNWSQFSSLQFSHSVLSNSLLKLMSIELVMPSSHLILCHPLLLLPPIPPSIRVFSNESTLRVMWPKYWSFSFSISPSNEHPGLISFRMD